MSCSTHAVSLIAECLHYMMFVYALCDNNLTLKNDMLICASTDVISYLPFIMLYLSILPLSLPISSKRRRRLPGQPANNQHHRSRQTGRRPRGLARLHPPPLPHSLTSPSLPFPHLPSQDGGVEERCHVIPVARPAGTGGLRESRESLAVTDCLPGQGIIRKWGGRRFSGLVRPRPCPLVDFFL